MSQDINSLTITGRVVRDAEIKYTKSGTAITSFSIASNRAVKTEEGWRDEGQFFDVSLFGKSGEAIHKYLTKGTSVAVQGELRQERWEKDGRTNSKVSIVATFVKLMSQGSGQKPSAPKQQEYNDDRYSPNDFQEDIPF